MPKHTPGPWITRSKGSQLLIEYAPERYIAEIQSCPNRIANSRLIAAAPEMLKALETARDHLLYPYREIDKASAIKAITDAIKLAHYETKE